MAQKNLDIDKFLALEIPLPPIDVQKAIAAELDAQAADVATLEKAAAAAERAKRIALDNAIYSRGYLRPDDTLADNVQRVKLGDICEIAIGGTPSTAIASYYTSSTDGFPWVSITDLNGGIIIKTKKHITTLGVNNSSVKKVQAGTVLFSFKLSIGKTGMAGCDLYTNEAIAALSIRDQRLCSKYLFHSLSAGIYTGGRVIGIIGAGSLNKSSLSQIEMPLPPLDVQKAIAAELDEFDITAKKLTAAAERARAAMKTTLEKALAAIPEGTQLIRKETLKPKEADGEPDSEAEDETECETECETEGETEGETDGEPEC